MQTIEAEIASSSQQSKIDELEAQLQEAEGVIVDLRGELKWVRDKLENVRNNQVQPLNEKVIKDNELSYQNTTPEPTIDSPSNSGLQTVTNSDIDMKNTLLDRRVFNNKCCNATEEAQQLNCSHFEDYSSHKAELASIFMRNKEPELYRYGCTQRICASEGNLLGGKLSPAEEIVDQHHLKQIELITQASKQDEGKCTAASPNTKNMETMKNFSGEEVRKHVKVRMSRRRKNRFGKAKAKRRSCPSQLTKPYQRLSILSRCRTYSANGSVKSDGFSHSLISVKADNMDLKKSSSELEGKLQDKTGCFLDEKMIVHKEKEQRKVQGRDTISTLFTSPPDQLIKNCQPSSLLTHCKAYSFLLYGNVKSNEDRSKITENEVKLKPLTRLDPGLTLIKGGVDPISGSTNVTVSVKALNRAGTVQNAANKDMELVDESAKQEHDAADNSTVSCYESNPEMVNVPIVYSDLRDAKASEETVANAPLVYSDLKDAKSSKEPDVFPSQVDNNRLLKYTFQRKRKKEALSSPDQSISLEKSTVKRRAGETQNDSPEPQKSSLINESSRDSRRLAQVARQVGSLFPFVLYPLKCVPDWDNML